jgi:nucleotide-binding universal stress UspA family protein
MSGQILVGLSLREDDAAPLALARTLATLTDASLALVTAFPQETYPPIATPEYALAWRADARARLEAIAQPLRQRHEVSTEVRRGSPAGVLHDAAERVGAIAVIVGSSHRGPLGRVLAGDVAAGLLHGAPCPVVVAPRGYAPAPAGIARIGVAFLDTNEGREALAAAIALARLTDASVHSYTVLEPPQYTGAYAVPGWTAPPSDAPAAARGSAQEAAEAALATLGIRGSSKVLHGRAVAELARVSQDVDLLVCGSRGHGALRSAFAGGVSRGLAHSCACPLLLTPRRTTTNATLWHPAEDVAVS